MAESSRSFDIVTRQIAREEILNNQRRESFKSYIINDMFASSCSFTKNDPLCMSYHPYHFVGEVMLNTLYKLF